jgi:ATP-dependent DNA ligase
MLARAAAEIPRGAGWVYEPKWDGFRAIVYREGGQSRIDSRNGQRLDRYFPELLPGLERALPGQCVVDGEIVVAGAAGLDFDALLQRIHPAASRVQRLAVEWPATLVAFDLLAVGEEDLRAAPLEQRWARLAAHLRPNDRCLLTPRTTDPDTAADWFERFEGAGLDGIIAKRVELPYRAGERVLIKVKHQRTADCVVGGYRLSKAGKDVGSVLLGLYDDGGVLHYVGFTSSFSSGDRRALLERLRPIEGAGGFGRGRSPGGPSRWTRGRDLSWTSVSPVLVCEVAFDHLQGERFRHGARFLRWRPDKLPAQCTFDQIVAPAAVSLEEIRAFAERPASPRTPAPGRDS